MATTNLLRVALSRPILLLLAIGLALQIVSEVGAVEGERGSATRLDDQPMLQLEAGDHIVILGDQFADSMRRNGYLETILHVAHPNAQLSIRNMGWGGDTVYQQLRPAGFGDIHSHLTEQQTDVIILCFGMMDSYRGIEKVSVFQEQLTRMVDSFRSRQYHGGTSPRVLLVSPIAHETMGQGYPETASRNRELERYTQAIQEVAIAKTLPFIDLYSPTYAWMNRDSESSARLTADGIHLTDQGYLFVSQIMAQQLGVVSTPASMFPSFDATLSEPAEQIRQAVLAKDFQFFMRWRAANGEYLYGRRRTQWDLDAEAQQQEEIIAQAQQHIWDLPKPPLAELFD